MKLFELSLQGMIVRFYLMMTVVIAAGFSGYWAFALLALPIFISGMVGLTFNTSKKTDSSIKPVAKEVEMNTHRGIAA